MSAAGPQLGIMAGHHVPYFLSSFPTLTPNLCQKFDKSFMKINSHSVIAVVALERVWLPLWAFSYIQSTMLGCEILESQDMYGAWSVGSQWKAIWENSKAD